ncbi:MAG: hypothetical protein V1909_03195, partial [Candidatus Micrarchaeota archaeon]
MTSTLASKRIPEAVLTKDPNFSFRAKLGDKQHLEVERIDKGFSKYVLSRVEVDTSWLSEKQKACVQELMQAGRAIDAMFYRQLTPHGFEIKELLEQALQYMRTQPCIGERNLGARVLEYYNYLKINHGYYDDANEKRKFVPSFSLSEFLAEFNPRNAVSEEHARVLKDIRTRFLALSDEMYLHKGEERPPGVEFYPKSIRATDIDMAINVAAREGRPLPQAFVDSLGSMNTILKGKKDLDATCGWSLSFVPYEREFASELKVVASHMRKAADIIEPEDGAFAIFLRARAKAIISGKKEDYDSSDVLWLKLDAPIINIVIGPIETYDDKLLAKRTSLQAFITIQNTEATKRVQAIRELMPEFIANLPCDDRYKNRPDEPVPTIDFVDAVG